MKKAEAEAKYKVPAYPTWAKVPRGFYTKSSLKLYFDIVLPPDTKPDAVKTDGSNNKEPYLLFNVTKYVCQLPEPMPTT